MSSTFAQPGFFLDRDGVLIEEIGYIHRPEDVVLLPCVAAALRQIEAAGFEICVITNQAGVARGKFGVEAIHAVNQRIFDLLAEEGIWLRYFYACPHHPSGVVAPWNASCPYRKPSAGLLQLASDDLNLALGQSFMIGDKISDLQAWANVGCRTALVRTGHGPDHVEAVRQNAVSLKLITIADTLPEAVEACLKVADKPTARPPKDLSALTPVTVICPHNSVRAS